MENSSQLLPLITNNIPILISYVDKHLKYQFVNRFYYEWHKLELDRIIGKTVPEILGQSNYEKAKPHINRILTHGNTI